MTHHIIYAQINQEITDTYQLIALIKINGE